MSKRSKPNLCSSVNNKNSFDADDNVTDATEPNEYHRKPLKLSASAITIRGKANFFYILNFILLFRNIFWILIIIRVRACLHAFEHIARRQR